MVWAKALWTTAGGKNFPPFFYGEDKMKELSIFIDESGDFGETKEYPSYYIVTFVFHDQHNRIERQVLKLEESIRISGFEVEYIHTGPVIRREDVFKRYSIDERRKLLYKMLNFVNSCPISYLSVIVDRKEAADKIALSGKLAKAINREMSEHILFFAEFDKVIVYYDYGQMELSAILNAVFSIQFSNVEFRKAEPQKYRLLQAADFICSMELLKIKREEKRLSKTEEQSFYKPQELKKTFLKSIEKKGL